MRHTAFLAGLFLCGFIFATNNSTVSAEALQPPLILENTKISNDKLAVLDLVEKRTEELRLKNTATEPVVHLVAQGETLASIAVQYQTTWQRLYAKNTNLSNPDVIVAGDLITIPGADEQIVEREVPAPIATPAVVISKPKVRAAVSRGGVAGNSYSPGYCTWYAKNRRPDLPNNLGNADTWVSRAAAQGIATGSSPRVGAIGQRGMHVVYVESVNADGSVTVSEMNSRHLYEITSRTVPASYFRYIY